MASPPSGPVAALRRRHAGIRWPFRIKAKLGDQTRTCDARIAFNGNGRVGPCSGLASTDNDAILRQDLASLTGTIPRLAGHRQQP
jgi:hypothetical protein